MWDAIALRQHVLSMEFLAAFSQPSEPRFTPDQLMAYERIVATPSDELAGLAPAELLLNVSRSVITTATSLEQRTLLEEPEDKRQVRVRQILRSYVFPGRGFSPLL
jgi:hypothetical protein